LARGSQQLLQFGDSPPVKNAAPVPVRAGGPSHRNHIRAQIQNFSDCVRV
jgi:hypothetical protein